MSFLKIPVLTSERKKSIILSSPAGVAKLVYALDSKSSGLNAHVGSTPTLGTTYEKSGLEYLDLKAAFFFDELIIDGN